MSRPPKPVKFCPNCSLLHAYWKQTCRDRLWEEIRSLREQLARATLSRSVEETPREPQPNATLNLAHGLNADGPAAPTEGKE